MLRRCTLLVGVCFLLSSPALAADSPGAQVVEVTKIWDRGAHNAFTDLIRFQDRWWCCFREAAAHVGGDGKIRIITSLDGRAWESAALLEEPDVDLRDPKLSLTPDQRLMIVAGGSIYLGTRQLQGCQPRVSFSPDGRQWSAPHKVLSPGEWLWRVTWHEGRAYGAAYSHIDTIKPGSEWKLKLYRSSDGLNWNLVGPMEVSGQPNETTLRFLHTGELMALVRREAGATKGGWIGVARPPFTRWTWHETDFRLGGPNFIELPDGSLWAGTRSHGQQQIHTVIARLSCDGLTPLATLPSGGDTSYPGLVYYQGLLWVSYYSSHEGQTCIYLAKVKLPSTPGEQQ